jgi:rhodanese-related sulfurtransferase
MDTVTPSVTPVFLFDSLGSQAFPFVIDVRRRAAFEDDPEFIAGATWRNPFAVADWSRFVPRHRSVVVYCVHGHEISRNACNALRSDGIDSRYLDGGIEAWRAAGGPTVTRLADLPIPSPGNAPSRWITRERPRIDRIACPWLVRRFIDPLAEFDFVPADRVLAESRVREAIPYDVPDVRFAHRGPKCSFDALIEDFRLRDPSLALLATIVRAADTNRLDLAPQSAGLLAISIGLGARHADDHELLESGFPVYDALYAWCRRETNASGRPLAGKAPA